MQKIFSSPFREHPFYSALISKTDSLVDLSLGIRTCGVFALWQCVVIGKEGILDIPAVDGAIREHGEQGSGTILSVKPKYNPTKLQETRGCNPLSHDGYTGLEVFHNSLKFVAFQQHTSPCCTLLIVMTKQ